MDKTVILNHSDPVMAARHFAWRLQFETDPADVHAELAAGGTEVVLVDTRSRQAYESGHIAGAVSLPHQDMNELTIGRLDRTKRYVTYCWGPGCNAATKGAMKLAAAGLRVKEMIGGVEYWEREGYPIESDRGVRAAGLGCVG